MPLCHSASANRLNTLTPPRPKKQEPGYILIKRWVPEWEQDQLWEHTRKVRIVEKKREEKVVVEVGSHKKHGKHLKEDEFEWVRKKERRRSKSPGLLMYLAGARPA